MNNDFSDMSDDDLFAYEQSLYDRECDGEDVWFERDHVLWEINKRGLIKNERR